MQERQGPGGPGGHTEDTREVTRRGGSDEGLSETHRKVRSEHAKDTVAYLISSKCMCTQCIFSNNGEERTEQKDQNVTAANLSVRK